MADEVWKDIPGFEGHYEVSSLGRVSSVARRVDCHCAKCGEPTHSILRRGRLLFAREDSHGLRNVRLAIPGKERRYKDTAISRLVLLAFVGEPGPDERAFHLDGDKTNNQLSNLRWMTPTDYYAYRSYQKSKVK